MMRLIALAALTTTTVFSVPALAQDANCAKLRNARQKMACNCVVSGGGYARDVGNNTIRWYAPRGGNPAISACLAKVDK